MIYGIKRLSFRERKRIKDIDERTRGERWKDRGRDRKRMHQTDKKIYK